MAHAHAAGDALWDDNREFFEGLAHEIALRYGLTADDADAIAADIRAALWARIGHIVTARQPATVAATVALQAANDAARSMVATDDWARFVERQRRAKRRAN